MPTMGFKSAEQWLAGKGTECIPITNAQSTFLQTKLESHQDIKDEVDKITDYLFSMSLQDASQAIEKILPWLQEQFPNVKGEFPNTPKDKKKK